MLTLAGVGTVIINFSGPASPQRHDPSFSAGHALSCTPNPEEPLKLRTNCTTYSSTASVCGAIRDKYEALGGPVGPLGYPTSNELTNPDGVGKRNTFQNQGASIYWSPATGANEVRGLIAQKWGQLGYERGFLGYPTSDELTNPDRAGKKNTFAKNGAIYWSTNTGAHEVHGTILDKYRQLNETAGCHAYPMSDVTTTSAGPRVDFAGGLARGRDFGPSYIYVSPRTTLSSCSNDPNEVPAPEWQWRYEPDSTQPPAGTQNGPQNFTQSAAAAVPAQPMPSGPTLLRPRIDRCPPGTDTYGGPNYTGPPPNPDIKYRCLSVYRANAGNGYAVGVRVGTNIGSGFGLDKTLNRHGVNEETIGAVVFNNPRGVEFSPGSGNFDYKLVLRNVETQQSELTVLVGVLQKPGDDPQKPPDGDLGVITAFCPGYQGKCPPFVNQSVVAGYID